MEWKRRYEESLFLVLETKNEYDFACTHHRDLIVLVQEMKDTLSTMAKLMRTCSSEDYDVMVDQYYSLFDEWNRNTSLLETYTGKAYREMIHASEHSSILYHRYREFLEN
jgi:hypothetical protein